MDAIAGLDEQGFRVRTQSGEWTAAEVLAHLLSTERLFTQRARAALDQVDFVITPRTEDERQEGARMAQRMPVPQIVHGLLAQRRDTLRLLDGLSDEHLARSVRHPRWGEQSVAWLFRRIAEHEAEHAEQVRSLRAQPAAEPL